MKSHLTALSTLAVTALSACATLPVASANFSPDSVVVNHSGSAVANSEEVVLTARLAGQLETIHGCTVVAVPGGGYVTPVWPAGTQLTADSARLRVPFARRTVELSHGQRVSLAGGAAPATLLARLGVRAPQTCPADYFLVSDIGET